VEDFLFCEKHESMETVREEYSKIAQLQE